jgi:dipeptidase D
LLQDENFVYAKDTTLGGDDGIAVAYMLAIAESDEIAHPPLELIITVSEEVGMEGAKGIDLSMLKGHRMLNLDSEEEGVFLSSCAGGLSTKSKLPVSFTLSEPLDWYKLSVSGLLGGHSGCEIDKGRANANRLLGRVLFEMEKETTFFVAQLEGGKKDNAIPLYGEAVLGMEESQRTKAEEIVSRMEQIIRAEYGKADPDIRIGLQKISQEKEERMVLEKPCLSNVITLLMTLPEGIQGMSMSVPGLVETSLNLGIMKLNSDHLFLQHAIRSSVTTKKCYVADQVERIVTQLGGHVERKGEYPAWEYREISTVRPRVIALYEKMYGKTPVVEGIHAGLECGLLAGKIPELDCVAMGPDILDIHTTSERLDIASTKRVYDFLIEYLKIKDEEFQEDK